LYSDKHRLFLADPKGLKGSKIELTDCENVLNAWARLGRSGDATDCCEMDGVECDSNSNVISISWISKDFRGSIPGELFKLKELRWL
jgi:hypothetical protein